MATRCLICDSRVVIHQDGVESMVLFIGATNGFLRGISNARAHVPHNPAAYLESPLASALYLLVSGVVGAQSGGADSTAFAQAVKKYQFSGYDYLCLRCGARYDEQDQT